MNRSASQRSCVVALKDYYFALEGAYLQQMMQLTSVTPVPRSSAHLLGLFHFQGAILPLMDLQQLLQLPGATLPSDLAVLVRHEDFQFAFSVDSVLGFFMLEQIDISLDVPQQVKRFCHAQAKLEAHTALVLDIPKIVENLKTRLQVV
jgi:chemotaxis signal transduction protein